MITRSRINALLLVLPIFLFFACSDDDSAGPDDIQDPAGTISGIVHDAFELGVPGALITAPGITGESNEQGWFYLSGVPVGQYTLSIGGDGYLTTYRNVSVSENQTTHIGTVVLMTAESQTIDSDTGGEVETADGDGSVILAGDSFISQDGSPYTGNVTVEISVAVPGDGFFFNAFPGEFEGIREDGSTVPFQSYGFMGVNLFDPNGSRLQLGDGRTADLRIRIPGDVSASAPDSIPMWYFDETAGVWREEGMAVRQDDRYHTSVAHLSVWNWDYPLDDVCTVEGRVLDDQGSPVSGARVISQGATVTYMDESYSSAQGNFSVRVLKNSTASIWATKGGYASEAVTVEIGEDCPVVMSEALTLREPAFSIALRWGQNPSDLDSHFFIPMTWDGNWDYYHIAYYNLGTLSSDPFTALDTDDVTSYGPEIVSGFSLYSGTYAYYVHLFSGSGTIADSPAIVDLQIAGQARSYDASRAGGAVGEHWHVFNIVVGSNGSVSVEDVNRFEMWDYGDANVYEGFGGRPDHRSNTKR